MLKHQLIELLKDVPADVDIYTSSYDTSTDEYVLDKIPSTVVILWRKSTNKQVACFTGSKQYIIDTETTEERAANEKLQSFLNEKLPLDWTCNNSFGRFLRISYMNIITYNVQIVDNLLREATSTERITFNTVNDFIQAYKEKTTNAIKMNIKELNKARRQLIK
tara:strand:+ start:312 stop:803 length:492 start_codon:yes stop_codon:yes gene_type:complete